VQGGDIWYSAISVISTFLSGLRAPAFRSDAGMGVKALLPLARTGDANGTMCFRVLAHANEMMYNVCMSDQQPLTTVTIRVPSNIAEQLRRLAKEHDRSLNGEIVRVLREYVERQQQSQEPRQP
jgi:hypothetical protein